MQEMTDDNLEQLVKDNTQVVVQYGASWCGVCRLLKPSFKKKAGENASVVFVYVDAEKNENSRSLVEIENLPTFASFKNGEVAAVKTGGKPEIIQEVIDALTSN